MSEAHRDLRRFGLDTHSETATFRFIALVLADHLMLENKLSVLARKKKRMRA